MEQKVTTPLTKGIIISLLLIVLSLITYFMDLSMNKSIQYVGYLILIAGVIWAISTYGKQINYNATFGNYFAHGFKVSAIITLIMILFTLIFLLVFPEIKEKAIEVTRKSLEDRGGMTPEQINNALDITKKFFMVFTIAGILFFYLLLGVIASLIGAGVTKKNPTQFPDAINQ